MATLLHRLGKTAYRRWPFFIAAWLIAFLAVGIFAGTMSKPMTDAFSIPGIPSEKAADMQAELFPGAVDAFDQASVKVVVAAPEGHTLDEPAYADQVAGAGRRPGGSPADARHRPGRPGDRGERAAGVRSSRVLVRRASDLEAARANAEAVSPLSEDGRVGTITWDFDVETVDRRRAGDDRGPRRDDGPREPGRPHRRGERLRLGRHDGDQREVRADRHRGRAAGAGAHLRFADGRGPPDRDRPRGRRPRASPASPPAPPSSTSARPPRCSRR